MRKRIELTVLAIAAGTLAMMLITGFKLSNMKVVASKFARNLRENNKN